MNLEPTEKTLQNSDKPVNVLDNELSDIEIIQRVLAGTVDNFELIMRRYNQRLFRIARSIVKEDDEAMDVVQEAYVKAYYQLATFKGPDGFASWLSRIVSNESLMRLRKSNRISYTLDDPMNNFLEGGYLEGANEDLDPQIQPLQGLASEQLRGLLERAVDQLPTGHRTVYMMRAVQQLSTRETALSLDVTEDVVKTRFLRAKRQLQKIFAEHIEKTGLSLHEFAGHRCNSIVSNVLKILNN